MRGHEHIRADKDAQPPAHVEQAHEIELLKEGEIRISAGKSARRPAPFPSRDVAGEVVHHALYRRDRRRVRHDAHGGFLAHETRDELVERETQSARDQPNGVTPREVLLHSLAAEDDARLPHRHRVRIEGETHRRRTRLRSSRAKLFRTREVALVGVGELLPAKAEIA